MEKTREKEILENFCCKEVIFALLCIIACVVLFFVRARFPAGTVIRAALGVVEVGACFWQKEAPPFRFLHSSSLFIMRFRATKNAQRISPPGTSFAQPTMRMIWRMA